VKDFNVSSSAEHSNRIWRTGISDFNPISRQTIRPPSYGVNLESPRLRGERGPFRSSADRAVRSEEVFLI
jgi:hypothetical protein